MSTESRRNQILAVALKLAESDHYQSITREQISVKARTATGTINRVFGTMVELRDAVVLRAIEEECLPIIAQIITANDGCAAIIPLALKRKALKALI